MSERQVIGRGTWLDKVAYRIIEREKTLPRDVSTIRVESGLGASGIPHVGNLGDAARAHGIRLALEDMGYRSELIAYSDDMDGLRKVPIGFPDWLTKYIGHPVSLIPDPFGCHQAYGRHMTFLLLDGLDRLGIEYSFQSGTEAYKSGILREQTHKILLNSKVIGKKIAEMVSQRKFEEILPYFPICENCGRIYLAEAYSYIPDERKVLYRCKGTTLAKKFVGGCGHQGEARTDSGIGKLSWKGEFAARWSALDIRFEAYGKDIADSVKVNDWISDEILGFPHPYHVRYELFLDKSGRKVSKSVGNVLTSQVWLRYGSPESLMLLMFKRVAGTRALDVEDIPTYVDEYDTLEDIYFSNVKMPNPTALAKLKGLYEYVNGLKGVKKPSPHVPYRMLVELATVGPSERKNDYVSSRLMSYGMVKEIDEKLRAKISLACNWAHDFSTRSEKISIQLSDSEQKALGDLVEYLALEDDPKKIQHEIFEIAKRNNLEPPDFFRILYMILIRSEKGPRLGPYIADIGKARVIEVLRKEILR